VSLMGAGMSPSLYVLPLSTAVVELTFALLPLAAQIVGFLRTRHALYARAPCALTPGRKAHDLGRDAREMILRAAGPRQEAHDAGREAHYADCKLSTREHERS
jgi:hypothetical protein